MAETEAHETRAGIAPGGMLRLGLGLALATLIIDQVHKWWMISIYGIELHERITVTPLSMLIS